jgi:hypothetical protein
MAVQAASVLPARRRSLVWLNVLGGVAVLASYALAFTGSPELRSGLWGDVPHALRPVYTVSMLLAAAGYFPFTLLLVYSRRSRTRFSPGLLHALYALVLIPSAFWLPLTARMLREPSTLLWAAIRIDLLLVAAGATGLLFVTASLARERRDARGWLALAGAFFFWVQTALLDALVWPALFPR